jgi:hypothetical protein
VDPHPEKPSYTQTVAEVLVFDFPLKSFDFRFEKTFILIEKSAAQIRIMLDLE